MHHIHNSVNAQCAPTDICSLFFSIHNVDMRKAHTKTFIRDWRKHRGKTLVQAAEYLHMNHGQLSRIERGEQPYNQYLLEKLADFLMCDPVDLLVRNPNDPEAIWSIWDKAKPGERAQIVAVANALIESRERPKDAA